MVEQNFEDSVLLSTGKILYVSNKPKQPSSNLDDSDKVVVERVHNVWGSSSGAGSDFLDTYRKQRNAEMLRLEEMDKKWREDMENKLFHSQRIHRIKKESDKTLKRKMKRDRRRQKSNFLKQSSKSQESNSVDSDQKEHTNKDSKVSNIESENFVNSNSDSSHNSSNDSNFHNTADECVEPTHKPSNLVIFDQSLNDF